MNGIALWKSNCAFSVPLLVRRKRIKSCHFCTENHLSFFCKKGKKNRINCNYQCICRCIYLIFRNMCLYFFSGPLFLKPLFLLFSHSLFFLDYSSEECVTLSLSLERIAVPSPPFEQITYSSHKTQKTSVVCIIFIYETIPMTLSTPVQKGHCWNGWALYIASCLSWLWICSCIAINTILMSYFHEAVVYMYNNNYNNSKSSLWNLCFKKEYVKLFKYLFWRHI